MASRKKGIVHRQVIRGIECAIRRISYARRLTLTIHYDGSVTVTAPRQTKHHTLLSFVWNNYDFIHQQLAQLQQFRQPLFEDTPPRLLYQGKWYRVRVVQKKNSPDSLRFLSTHFVYSCSSTTNFRLLLQKQWIEWGQKQARKILPPLTQSLAEELQLKVQRISIRNQKSRWGSCTASRKSISLNWRLILFPPSVMEYLIYHELAHLRYPHHGPRYWALVEKWKPDYRECEQWLSRHGPVIMALTTPPKQNMARQFELFQYS